MRFSPRKQILPNPRVCVGACLCYKCNACWDRFLRNSSVSEQSWWATWKYTEDVRRSNWVFFGGVYIHAWCFANRACVPFKVFIGLSCLYPTQSTWGCWFYTDLTQRIKNKHSKISFLQNNSWLLIRCNLQILNLLFVVTSFNYSSLNKIQLWIIITTLQHFHSALTAPYSCTNNSDSVLKDVSVTLVMSILLLSLGYFILRSSVDVCESAFGWKIDSQRHKQIQTQTLCSCDIPRFCLQFCLEFKIVLVTL